MLCEICALIGLKIQK